MITTEIHNIQIPKRFYSLDVLRGIASLAVVVWHWQHFFCNGNTESIIYNVEQQPFYSFLFLFYKKGFLAVELFFSLSGFVFFWLYSIKILENKINYKDFFVLRFSRLYPLHFFTLLIVASEQTVYHHYNNTFFIYLNNDLYHFTLNIFLISFWGFQNGNSFNGSVWSVSIEILLYIIFYIYSTYGGSRSIWRCLLIIIGSFCATIYLPRLAFFPLQILPIIKGLFSFFMGGISFLLFDKVVKSKYSIKKITTIFTIMTIFFWFLAITFLKYNLIPSNIFSKLSTLSYYFVTGLLFPLTIITLAIFETNRGTLGRRFQFIGDITYSSYLLHFPLQIIFVLFTNYFGIRQDFYYTSLSFFTFFIILIPFSLITFKFFEKPCQILIRKKFSKNV